MQRVTLPYSYFPNPTRGRPIFNGQVFVGEVDKDPELFPISVFVILENSDTIEVAQPLVTGAGGVILHEGSPAIVAVNSDFSLRVLDNLGVQVYYAPDSAAGGGSNSGGQGAYIPLAGTDLGDPVTGVIEWRTDGSNGSVTLAHENNFFGNADAMVWRANGLDTGFIFICQSPEGILEAAGFNANGQLILPSYSEAHTGNWVIGAGEILGVSNTLLFSAQNALGAQTGHNIVFSVDENVNFVFHADEAGVGTAPGVLELPRTTLAGDPPTAAVTKDYVDAAIPPGGGEANTMSCPAESEIAFSLVMEKQAADLPIKAIIGGTNTTIVEGADSITINSTGTGDGGDYIPLSGTLPGEAVTGQVVFDDPGALIQLNESTPIAFGGEPGAHQVAVAWLPEFATLAFLAEQTLGSVGYSFQVYDGGTTRNFGMNQDGSMKLGKPEIDYASNNSVLTLGWWKDDVLNADSVSFGGDINAAQFQATGNIIAAGSFTSQFGQFYVEVEQNDNLAARAVPRRDWIDERFVHKTDNVEETVTGVKTFSAHLNAQDGISAAGDIDTFNNMNAIGTVTAQNFIHTGPQSANTDSSTKKEYVDALNAQNMKLAGTQTVTGSKTFVGGTNFKSPDTGAGYSLHQLFYYNGGSTSVGSILSYGSQTNFNTSSDYRLKENVELLDQDWATNLLIDCPVKQWTWKSGHGEGFGFLAHELQDFIPQAVTGEKDGEEMQQVDYSKLVPLLWAQNQELLRRIEVMEALLVP